MKKVVEFQEQLAVKKIALSIRLLDFSKEWLKGHIARRSFARSVPDEQSNVRRQLKFASQADATDGCRVADALPSG